MNCSQLNFSDSLINSYDINNGKVYFFENYYVLEIKEGVTVSFKNSKDVLALVNRHYADGRPFGLIANRVNSYSIDLSEVYKFKTGVLNPIANAVVYYHEKSIKFFSLENHFCHLNRRKFNSFCDAEKWILGEVKHKTRSLTA